MIDQKNQNQARFLHATRKYSDITELNVQIQNDLIESIVVYHAEGKRRKYRVQKVKINYKFIGLMQMDERRCDFLPCTGRIEFY